MHWLEEWMRSECNIATKRNPCRDCGEICAPCMILSQETGAYVATIKSLALEAEFVTCATLANRIAQYTGATAQQRDMLVNPIHHGEWKPDGRRRRGKPANRHPQTPVGQLQDTGQLQDAGQPARAIVMIDTCGNELQRFAGLAEAEYFGDRKKIGILNRCDRKISSNTNEFNPHGTSYRWADEWDRMTQAERRADIENTLLQERKRAYDKAYRRKYYEFKGKKHTVAEWARIANLPEEVLRKRIKSGWDFETAIMTPVREK